MASNLLQSVSPSGPCVICANGTLAVSLYITSRCSFSLAHTLQTTLQCPLSRRRSFYLPLTANLK